MMKLLAIACMMLGFVFTAAAQDNPVSAEQRAQYLTNQMIKELRLNNYQSRELRAINMDKISKIMAIETKHAGNQAKIDALCKEVCNERDRELEDVLSTEQYNNYYGNRVDYTKADRAFVAQAQQNQNTTDGALTVAQVTAVKP